MAKIKKWIRSKKPTQEKRYEEEKREFEMAMGKPFINIRIEIPEGFEDLRPQFLELEEDEQFFAPLSPREMEILELVIRGMSNREIAYHLGISHQTVKNHMTSILSKLGVADRTQAAVYALRHGWVPLREQRRQGRGFLAGTRDNS